MLRSGIKDMTAGFRAYKTSFLSTLDLAGVAAAVTGFRLKWLGARVARWQNR
jgi:hypothetical protein